MQGEQRSYYIHNSLLLRFCWPQLFISHTKSLKLKTSSQLWNIIAMNSGIRASNKIGDYKHRSSWRFQDSWSVDYIEMLNLKYYPKANRACKTRLFLCKLLLYWTTQSQLKDSLWAKSCLWYMQLCWNWRLHTLRVLFVSGFFFFCIFYWYAESEI